MQQNFIKQKLAAGNSVIGMWTIINSPITAEISARAGLDFQIFDMEHGVFDLPSLDNCMRAAEITSCSPLVRVPKLDHSIIQSCLDLGAHGIIVPQIRNSPEAIATVQATKFAPQGSRGFNPFTRAGLYNPKLPLTSTKLNNDFGLTAIIVENKSCYLDLEKILTIPHLDLLYLGIYDLSFDLGLEGNTDHPSMDEYIASAIKKIKQAGKYAGVMARNENEMEKYLDLGANVIVHGVDTYTYYSVIQHQIQTFKSLSTRNSNVRHKDDN